MAQTPQQRKANLKFARAEEAKRGKPQSTYKQKLTEKSPISRVWIGVLLFVLCGAGIFELFNLFFGKR